MKSYLLLIGVLASLVYALPVSANLWVVADMSANDKAVEYTTGGTPTGNFIDLGAQGIISPWGITTDGMNFYVVSTTNDDVYVFTMGGSFVTSWDAGATGTGKRGITFDGTYLWLVDILNDELYKYSTAGVYQSVSFDTNAQGNTDPNDTFFDGTYFWVNDATDQVIRQYDKDGTFIDDDADISGEVESGRSFGIGGDSTGYVLTRDSGIAAALKGVLFYDADWNYESFFSTYPGSGVYFPRSVVEVNFHPFIASAYSQIKNTTNGKLELKAGPSTSTTTLKTLPEDWVVYVSTTTDAVGAAVIADGYRWYQVTDKTDNVSGWMVSQNASGTVVYLPYDSSRQSELASTSDNYIATSSRPDLILDIFEEYYNNASTTYSLYSGDDGDNDISVLKDRDFEEKVLWGIAAQESGGISFDNQYVSSDYGHGIMQITFSPSHWDNRGVGSRVVIPPCEAVVSSDYTNCYGGTNPKYYQSYGGNPGNPTYKQYTNTEQSIYSNIKDSLKVLQYKYGNFYPIATSTTVNGTTYTAVQRETILVTEGYNGACGYVDDVADRLDEIDTFFPTATSSDISTLKEKMHIAGDEVICAQLHSPANLSIQDEKGRIVGITEKGELKNDFPLALYDKNEKMAKILSPETDNYTYKVIGTGNGSYGFDLTIKQGDEQISFKASGIRTKPKEIHMYSIDKKKLTKGDSDAVSVQIDKEGDGVIDKVLEIGPNISDREF